MKKFNTTPEERLTQLENLVQDQDVTSRIILDEIRCLRESFGIKKSDEWFATLTEVNDNAIKQTYNNW